MECYNNQINFTAKDKKGLAGHMSKKRPQAYEESKKVPNIRIAWNIDEDKILANLEIHHKSIQKDQILDRLYIEWDELVEQPHANDRSKEAIRGQCQQVEYKAILADLLSRSNNVDQPIDTLSDDSTSTTESTNESVQDIATHPNDVSVLNKHYVP